MKKKLVWLLAILFISLNVSAERVSLKASDGFQLAANFVDAGSNAKFGVLMLHQCNADKSMYSDLAKLLGEQNVTSLALDFRGFADSTTPTFSRKLLRKESKNRKEFMNKIKAVNKFWQGDVELAYEYLADKIGSDNISIIGASCGGYQAVKFSQKIKPQSLVLFSSGLDEKGIASFNHISEIPALIIASQDDAYTFNSSNKIFLSAKSPKTRLLVYKGNGHGRPLFKHDPNLENIMVDWFLTRASSDK
ncbi:MAG: alpha/beta hydrolase [Kangiella sp.]|nr:MAG: alpha/beta hydrolase [Kangiella sp.]